MVPASIISFSIIVTVAVEIAQPVTNVISTFIFCPSVILFTVNVLSLILSSYSVNCKSICGRND